MSHTNRLARPMTATFVVVSTAYLIFIVLGIPDGLLNVAWPSIRTTFSVNDSYMGGMLLPATIGFIITSFNAGRLIARLGIVNLLIVSSVLRGVALIALALAPSWLTLTVAFFFFGVGSGAIDAGMNTYFAMNLSPRLMNWLHACFGLGATAGPALMTAVLSSGAEWRWGYVIVGVLQAGLSLLLLARISDWRAQDHHNQQATDGQSPVRAKSMRATLGRPIVWVNIALFFFYAGTEVTAANWSYTLFTESRGVSLAVAGFWASVYWGSFTLGRFLFGIVADRLNVVNTIRLMIGVGILASVLFWWNPANWVGFIGLALLGFAMAPIFPLLVSATPSRLGVADATNAIGFQVGAASFGIAILPGATGILVSWLNLEIVGPFVLLATVAMFVLHELAVRGRQ